MTAAHAAVRERLAMASYEISVRGHVDPRLLAGVGPLEADERPAATILRGSLPDGSGLRDVLARLQALGLELLEVRQVDAERMRR